MASLGDSLMDLPNSSSSSVKPAKRKKKKKKKKTAALGAFLESNRGGGGSDEELGLASVMAVGTPESWSKQPKKSKKSKKKGVDPAILAKAEATTQKALKQKQVDDLAEKLIAEWTAKAAAEKDMPKEVADNTHSNSEATNTTANWETTGAGNEGQKPTLKEEKPHIIEDPRAREAKRQEPTLREAAPHIILEDPKRTETQTLLGANPNEWAGTNTNTSNTNRREPMGYRPLRVVSATGYNHRKPTNLRELITEAMDDRTIVWKGLCVLLGLYLLYQILFG